MHQVQKITFRRKREKRNTNTSGEYMLTSNVVPLVTQFFVYLEIYQQSLNYEETTKVAVVTRGVQSHGVLVLPFTRKSGS